MIESTTSAAVLSTPEDLLVKAEELTQKGDYAGSNKILEDAVHHPENMHTVFLDASIDLLYARNEMQMNNHAKVWEHLSKIPEDIGPTYPMLDADRRSLTGIFYRRESYDDFKNELIEEALKKARLALIEFDYAAAAAVMANKYGARLLCNASLNRQYVEGLILRILAAAKELYRPLVVAALIAEYQSRRKMDDDNRDWVSGMTVVADLARGAGLTLADMATLSDDPNYLKAYRDLFGQQKNSNWPQFLMELCFPYKHKSDRNGISRVLDMQQTTADLKPEIYAKALLLGCKFLLAEKNLDAELLNSYAFELRYHYDLLGIRGTSSRVRQQIAEVFAQLPDNIYMRRRRADCFK